MLLLLKREPLGCPWLLLPTFIYIYIYIYIYITMITITPSVPHGFSVHSWKDLKINHNALSNFKATYNQLRTYTYVKMHNGYCWRKWNQWPKFKSWIRVFVFHFMLMPLFGTRPRRKTLNWYQLCLKTELVSHPANSKGVG